ncbi:Cof-type HAD-IIB family hydrolase [Halalkalibacter alkaliphilus]|uniref:Cof-type HAD-IIB family hydrolase n=1 Tax=Halalkalibacter alkaliphilus TaxID=2917993 RepID=A0A9X2A770_9BACI|nr:Cof-type HAD-IIB family hydrolase [Halalkalibacter alkaliphilus]MCL7747016.1 Cof-type HAD-IIB family hydrolase [Halalkalibacter alkaliphilus]
MTYKLLALNIDGTILRSNSKITKQTKDAIQYVKEKGVYVTLATSRPYPSAKKIAKALKVDGCLITSDGAFIAQNADEPIFVRRIQEEKALQVVDILERYDCHIRVLHEDFSIGNKVKQRNHLIAKMTIGVGDPLFYPIRFVDSVCEQLMQEPMAPPKIQVQFFEKEDQKRAIRQIEEMSAGVRVLESAPGRFEIVSAGVSKARGLQTLGQYLGIRADEMVAVGSQNTDVDMVNQVGLGVAMGNATDSVKEVADWLTRSNEQNGVSYMIREVFRKQLRVQL